MMGLAEVDGEVILRMQSVGTVLSLAFYSCNWQTPFNRSVYNPLERIIVSLKL
jgi:hypothetical protein